LFCCRRLLKHFGSIYQPPSVPARADDTHSGLPDYVFQAGKIEPAKNFVFATFWTVTKKFKKYSNNLMLVRERSHVRLRCESGMISQII
jgi:hypothetical protein